MWGKRSKALEEGLKVVAAGIGEWKEREKELLLSVENWMDDVEKKVDKEIGALSSVAFGQNGAIVGLQKEIVELRKEIERQQASIASYRDLVEQLIRREDGLLDRLMARNLKELKYLRLPEVTVQGKEGEYDYGADEELAGSVLGKEDLEALNGREMAESRES